mgnify:CR=1 FL=1
MRQQELVKLRQAVLTACTGRSLYVNDILDAPGVRPFVAAHTERKVRQVIYALTQAGLLHRSGDKRYAAYRTTRIGAETLQLHAAS